jgi:teichuronic acid biosynthesis glycosyltransferase TuaG
MTVYNHEKYVGEAAQSVLRQTHTNIELIAVDDHSRDSSYEIMLELANSDSRMRVIRHGKNEGCAAARNSGLLHAKGEYIAFMDSDDIWHPEKLERQIDFLAQSQAVLSYTCYTIIDSSGEALLEVSVPEQADLHALLKNNYIMFTSVCCLRSSVDGTFFNTDCFHEDFVFLMQLLQKGLKFRGINAYLLKVRKHSSGRSFNKLNAAWQRWKIYRNLLKLPFFSALFYFFAYALGGLCKYAKIFLLSLRS